MKKESNIFVYDIATVYEDAGRELINPNFFVFTIEEVVANGKAGKPYRSSHFAFLLLTEGEAHIRLNLINYTLTANSLFIIPPFLVHEFLWKSDDAKMTVMIFSHDFIAGAGMPKKHVDAFTFLASQNLPPLMLNEDDKETLLCLMVLLRKKNLSFDGHPFIQEVLQFGFDMFMMELAAIFQREQLSKKVLTRKEDLSMSFIKKLMESFKEERSVQFYADALFVTPKHLTKTVKELTGRTCGQFIDDMVITEAKILLNDLSQSVGNVADALNFSDQFFFSKFFKHRTGLSPTEYKGIS